MAETMTLGQRIRRWGWWAMSPLDRSEPPEESATIAAYADACERLALIAIRQYAVARPGMDELITRADLSQFDVAVADFRALQPQEAPHG